jgi:hypothetical protein
METQNTLQSGPLLGLKWTNLISSPNNNGEKLIGYINGGLAYSPEVTEGGFILGGLKQGTNEESEASIAVKNYFPKKLSLSFTFTVLHTHLVGWAPSGTGGKSFTFGGSQGTDAAFPNAFIAPPPPDPEEGGVRGNRETADDANGNLDETNEPTPKQTEDAEERRNEALNRGPDDEASAGKIGAVVDDNTEALSSASGSDPEGLDQLGTVIED